MGRILLDMTMSLDGFIAGVNDDDAGLHNYFFAPVGNTRQVIEEGMKSTGAIIMGRRTYEIGAQQDGFADNPYTVPTFVLSHTLPERRAKGAEGFSFIADGIQSALQQALAAAGDKDVVIGGGANIARQFIQAKLINEIQLHLVPKLLGAGIRLFEEGAGSALQLENSGTIDAPDATHLRFRVLR
jgi:dihydrofolate reductase